MNENTIWFGESAFNFATNKTERIRKEFRPLFNKEKGYIDEWY